jgi:hypothetical protein
MASKRKKRYLRALGIPGVRGSQPLEVPAPAPEPAPPVVEAAPVPKPAVKPVVKPAVRKIALPKKKGK